MMKTTVRAVAHSDIKGKVLLYIIIEAPDKRANNTVVINVGKKTYEAVKDLVENPTEEEIEERIHETVKEMEQKEEITTEAIVKKPKNAK